VSSVEELQVLKKILGRLPKTEFSSMDRPLDEMIKLLKSVIPSKAVKFEVDLSIGRTEKSLAEEGLIPAGKEFLYLIIVKTGTGEWSFKQVLLDGSTIEYLNDEVGNGYVIARRFKDILFTNPPQGNVENPRFIVEWCE